MVNIVTVDGAITTVPVGVLTKLIEHEIPFGISVKRTGLMTKIEEFYSVKRVDISLNNDNYTQCNLTFNLSDIVSNNDKVMLINTIIDIFSKNNGFIFGLCYCVCDIPDTKLYGSSSCSIYYDETINGDLPGNVESIVRQALSNRRINNTDVSINITDNSDK